MSGHPQPHDRDVVMMTARAVAGRGGAPICYPVRNLSASGACVAEPRGLAKARQLVVSIGQVDDIPAEVAWARGGFAGIRFLTPIDVALARRRSEPRSG